MLEAYSHNYLKSFIRKDQFAWPHNLTLSRLIARSLRRKDKSIFNLKIRDHNDCWLGILVPICIQPRGAVLLLTEQQRNRLINVELPKLRPEGFQLACWEGLKPPPGEQVWLLSYNEILDVYNIGDLQGRQLIVPEAELLADRFREEMAIKVTSQDWDLLARANPTASSALVQLHNQLTRKLFAEVTCLDGNVRMNFDEVFVLRDLVALLHHPPLPWMKVLDAIRQGWASWAELQHKTLDWYWNLQPLEPLLTLRQLFTDVPFVMLFDAVPNNLLVNQIKSFAGSFDVQVTLGNLAELNQEPINLFVPWRQPLPNTEYFSEYLLDQSRRLILGRLGLTILLIDDYQLLRKLTSELAAEFGKRVICESTCADSNGVICCSSSWWLSFQEKLPIPEQLIISILPFSTLESPLTAARVDAYKLKGLDWFRSLLLPELLTLLPKLVLPLRNNQGRVAVLDGRLRSRDWGKKIFTVLEPWNPLEHLLPY